jgi:hypothetical protein
MGDVTTPPRKKTKADAAPAPGRAPEWGEYGVVAVVKGRHKGRLGYYDDEGDSAAWAVVYLDGAPPYASPYVLIYRRWLRVVTRAQSARWELLSFNDIALARWHKANRERR